MKKVVNLKDHKNMMELMKKLYGNEDVKDDFKRTDTQREPGTKSACELAKLPPNCS